MVWRLDWISADLSIFTRGRPDEVMGNIRVNNRILDCGVEARDASYPDNERTWLGVLPCSRQEVASTAVTMLAMKHHHNRQLFSGYVLYLTTGTEIHIGPGHSR